MTFDFRRANTPRSPVNIAEAPSAVEIPKPDPQSPITASPAPRADIPDWYPAWAKELADLYYSGSVCLFLLHGNVHDLIGCQERGEQKFVSLHGVSDPPAVRLVGRHFLLRLGTRAAAGGRQRCATASGDGGVGIVDAGESEHLAARSREGAAHAGTRDSAELAAGQTGPAQTNRFPVRVRSVPGSLGRRQHAGPRRSIASGAADFLGPESRTSNGSTWRSA